MGAPEPQEAAWARLQHEEPGYAVDPNDQARIAHDIGGAAASNETIARSAIHDFMIASAFVREASGFRLAEIGNGTGHDVWMDSRGRTCQPST